MINNGESHYDILLEKIQVIKREIKGLKELYVGRRNDLEEKKRLWIMKVESTKREIDTLISWINVTSHIQWDLPLEILDHLDKFDYLEEYVENLKNQVQYYYELQAHQCKSAEYFAQQLRNGLKY